jgi:hypothetical protein
MDTIQTVQGSSDVNTVTLRDADGDPFTGYAGSEPITVQVWAGDDATPIAGAATADWLDHTAGTATVTLVGAVTAELEPATYSIRLVIGGADVYQGALEVGWAPGSAAAPTVLYCTFRDLKAVYATIEKLRTRTEDQAGFLGQRNEATQWFQDLLQRHFRTTGGLSTDFAFVPGISFAGAYLGAQAAYFRPGIKSAQLQGWLDAGLLDVTPQVVKACAYHAVALVMDGQVDDTDKGDAYAALARKFFARAEQQAALITAEIDSNSDGTNDTWIRLGVADTLEG